MELLGRHAGEVVTIGNDIRVTVMDIWRDYVLLAVETPAGVQIVRQQRQEQPDPEPSKTILVNGEKATWRVTTSTC